ncbi:MAG: endolytic transglycosylase MltG [Proteobacteria bacterium]|uniref:endolytic transglycosylase MltG n=1 Tax=Rudaea sp. TaxID=2136325 RepID=UPI001D97197A|nr:endolytic transglycosylase MltG [Pseudomonadota bacterium]MBS0567206.1 endolytic transglycosylase MltG [Pseudomonadota bacterium]
MSRPSPRFSFRRVLFHVVAILVIGAVVLGGYLFTRYRHFADAPVAGLAQATQIDVPIGAHLPAIVNLLDERGVRPGNPYFWRLLARELGVAGKLHAGEYALEVGLTPRALLKKMAAGEVIQHKFTIVEGWTFAQLRGALAQDAALQQTLSGVDDTELMRRLGDADLPPEGVFLPETYSYVKGMSDFDVLRRAREAMRKVLDKLWTERVADMPLKSPYEALILASIVEKETGRAEERPQIARVFLSRLKLGMKLQTDPTVIYGMGANYAGNIHRHDLDTDTPYNTYTRTGLPPTPIALPGKAALDAVIHPADTEALYFVARGNGSHEFSATLEAHNRAVAKYQLHRQ